MRTRRYQGIIRRSFITAVCVVCLIAVVVTAGVYRNAADLLRDEYCGLNQTAGDKAAEDLTAILNRADRLAVGIGVSQDTSIFWGSSNPEEVWINYYQKLKDILTSYTYSVSDSINGVMLYAPRFNRFFGNNLSAPYSLNGSQTDLEHNAGWVWEVGQWDEIWSVRRLVLRSANGRYPRVLTVIRLFDDSTTGGAVAVDVELDKMFQEIMENQDENTTILILDQDGNPLNTNDNRNSQLLNREQLLQYFDGSMEERAFLTALEDEPIAYAQQYVEKYGFYVIAARNLDGLDQQIHSLLLNAILMGTVCAVLGCLLVVAYTSSAKRPLDRILEMIRNPDRISNNRKYSDEMIQEAADYIVRGIQANAELESELEKRVVALRKSQLQTLKAQINPHFLLNTLNMIVMMIDVETGDNRAVQMIMALSDVLDYALCDGDLVKLSEEIDNARCYVSILETRYEGLFTTKYEIDPELNDIIVPRLLLQPVIENAVYHGIAAKGNPNGEIIISAHCQEVRKGKERIPMVRIEI